MTFDELRTLVEHAKGQRFGQPIPSLIIDCTYCGAQVGEPCHTLTTGRSCEPVWHGHSARYLTVSQMAKFLREEMACATSTT